MVALLKNWEHSIRCYARIEAEQGKVLRGAHSFRAFGRRGRGAHASDPSHWDEGALLVRYL